MVLFRGFGSNRQHIWADSAFLTFEKRNYQPLHRTNASSYWNAIERVNARGLSAGRRVTIYERFEEVGIQRPREPTPGPET